MRTVSALFTIPLYKPLYVHPMQVSNKVQVPIILDGNYSARDIKQALKGHYNFGVSYHNIVKLLYNSGHLLYDNNLY